MQSENENIEFDAAQGGLLKTALQLARNPASCVVTDDEYLALYLDNSLAQVERDSLENTLADSPATLARLILLHKELKLMLNPEHKTDSVEKHHAAEQVAYENFKSAQEKKSDLSNKLEGPHEESLDTPKRASENR